MADNGRSGNEWVDENRMGWGMGKPFCTDVVSWLLPQFFPFIIILKASSQSWDLVNLHNQFQIFTHCLHIPWLICPVSVDYFVHQVAHYLQLWTITSREYCFGHILFVFWFETAPCSFLTNQGITSLIGLWNPSCLTITCERNARLLKSGET